MDPQTAPKAILGKPVQIGFVVRDARRTAHLLSSLLGIGPFRFVDWPLDRPDMRTFYKGQQVRFRLRLAFANLPNIELELIQPLEGDNGFVEMLNTRGEGVHHLLFDVPDPAAVVRSFAEAGIGVTMSGTGLRPGTSWAHLDTVDLLGWSVELRNKLPDSDGTSPVPPVSTQLP